MNKILKFSILLIFLGTFSCSDDDDNRPLCSEYNIQNPNDVFIPCDDPESPCQCG
jgi:hypothetical protein